MAKFKCTIEKLSPCMRNVQKFKILANVLYLGLHPYTIPKEKPCNGIAFIVHTSGHFSYYILADTRACYGLAWPQPERQPQQQRMADKLLRGKCFGYCRKLRVHFAPIQPYL